MQVQFLGLEDLLREGIATHSSIVFFFFIYFYYLEANYFTFQWVLSYIDMNQPWHSSILDWRIPWTKDPGGLQSIGCRESDMTEVT